MPAELESPLYLLAESCNKQRKELNLKTWLRQQSSKKSIQPNNPASLGDYVEPLWSALKRAGLQQS
jgi:hypothetical protein